MTLSYIYGKIIKKLHGTCVLNSLVDKTAAIGPSCNIVGSKIAKYSYCGPGSHIVNTDIGAFCSISDHVFIGGAEHPSNRISTSPVFQKEKHSGPKKRFARFSVPTTKTTVIGNDVWVGHNVTIKQGVVVGDGAIIGSNALVTKDVPPYAIVGGVPAKIIKYRFPEEVINELLKTEWWNLSDEEISKKVSLFAVSNPTVEDILKLKE